jgi:hypothetical protein
MALKIVISVTISDSEKDSYRDPSGHEQVELFAVDEKEIATLSDGVTSALVKVAGLKFKAELAKGEGG